MWVIANHAEPDLAVGQITLHGLPEMLPVTVSVLRRPRLTAMEAEVVGPVRRFASSQLGT
jgi:hypothetical protein